MESLSLFFFKQKTAYDLRISDWSSDVCSSDLGGIVTGPTLAMIGEGANDEAVIPLPKGMRDGMLGGGGGATEVRIVLEGDDDLVRLFRRGIADRDRKSVV